MNELAPDIVVLRGTASDGVLKLLPAQKPPSAQPVADSPAADKKPTITAVEIQPFGTDTISVTWQQENQPAQQILLKKVRQ